MHTLIVSDLHLGSGSRSDLLRRAEMRAPLLELASEAERVVLLGDVLELRHGPIRDALAASRPFFEDLGRALAGGTRKGTGELVILAGNHDHALVDSWLGARGCDHRPPPLQVEQLFEPEDASPALERIAAWARPARTRVAYPGIWVRPDVYAMHGHYLDCHLTIPTLERLSVGVMSRVLGRPASTFDRVDDYEAVGAPVFAWRDAVARDGRPSVALNGLATVNAWRALGGAGARQPLALKHRLRRGALVRGFPVAVAALNCAGLGPLRSDVSASELRRAGLRAMGEVAARLDLGDAHVVFGHTHRAGPLAGDQAHEWLGCGGARLVNAGSWTYASIFLTDNDGESPYWPGVCVLVEEDGPPRLVRLLQDHTRAQLAPRAAASVAAAPELAPTRPPA